MTTDQAAELLAGSESVVVVPGYGMAVPQAQHAVKDLADVLGERGIDVAIVIGANDVVNPCASPRGHRHPQFPDGDDDGECAWPCRPGIMHQRAMVDLFLSLLGALRSAFRSRADLALENLALRQQLANLRRTSGRPRLRKSDRVFWLVLSRLWSRWAEVLVVVKPDTMVRWHRAGFHLFWRWKSRSRSLAESDVSAEVKTLKIVARPEVGGLHHRYERRAA